MKKNEPPPTHDFRNSADPQYNNNTNINTNNNNNNRNEHYNRSISALVRGIHDTGIRDIHTLHLPLVDEEASSDDDDHQQQLQLRLRQQKPSLQQQNRDRQLEKHHKNSHKFSHLALPKFIINIEPPDDASDGDGGGVGVGCDLRKPRSLTPDDDNGSKEAPPSPGRRFSQFNFGLRRFSHSHPLTGVLEMLVHIFIITFSLLMLSYTLICPTLEMFPIYLSCSLLFI